MSENVSEKNPGFTMRNVLRVLATLCVIFVFCPSFLVSCSGQSVNVSVMTAVKGVSESGQQIEDPHPLMLVCLLLPIAILALLFIKEFADRKAAVVILGCSAVDIVIWLKFRSSVKKFAEENYCSFETTRWYVMNMIVLILIILLTAIVALSKMKLDADLIAIFSGGGTQNVLNQMSSTMSQMSSAVTQIAGNVANNADGKISKENVIGYCAKCGSAITYGNKFCALCGTPIPESMLAEAEAAKRAAEERTMFCQQCGAKLEPDAAFCMSCGIKVK